MPPLAKIVSSQMSDEALLWLLTFSDHNNNIVLRAVSNLEDVISRGDTYTAFPFEIVLPPDDGEKPQSLALRFPNVSQDLVRLIREYAPGLHPQVKMELIVASSPNTVEKTIDFMEMSNVTYDAMEIVFELSSSSIFARKTMTARYNQDEFPGLFYAMGGGAGSGSGGGGGGGGGGGDDGGDIDTPPIVTPPGGGGSATETIRVLSVGQGMTTYSRYLVNNPSCLFHVDLPANEFPATVTITSEWALDYMSSTLSANKTLTPILDSHARVKKGLVGQTVVQPHTARSSLYLFLNLQPASIYTRLVVRTGVTFEYL